MKTLISAFFLVAFSVFGAPVQPPVTWPIWWDQPTNMPVLSYYSPGTNQAYQVLSTQTLGTPMTNWPIIATWTNWIVLTNVNGAVVLSNNITVPFGQTFFFLNPTNTWGAAPLLSGYGAGEQTGPPWSTITSSQIGKQSP